MRVRILTLVISIVVVVLFSSVTSLLKISKVSLELKNANKLTFPLARLLGQLESDSEILKMELERGLSYEYWDDLHWIPQPVPVWMVELIENEMKVIHEKIQLQTSEDSFKTQLWTDWFLETQQSFQSLIQSHSALFQKVKLKDWSGAKKVYPHWSAALGEWTRQVNWGAQRSTSQVRSVVRESDTHVSDLRSNLRALLISLILLSILLLWFSDRTLRPLAQMSLMVKKFTERGIEKTDRFELPEYKVGSSDEVSDLMREFRKMALSIIEREKIVVTQKERLATQNDLLNKMGTLNKTILESVESGLISFDSNGNVLSFNPAAEKIFPSLIDGGDFLEYLYANKPFWVPNFESLMTPVRLGPQNCFEGVWDIRWIPLKRDGVSEISGVLLILTNLTELVALESKLKEAEHLAAVGRMSAQIAHDIRNPLQSISLEAEFSLDQVKDGDQTDLVESIRSIQESTERLERMTRNYLRLSKPNQIKKERLDLRESLESVLALFSPELKNKGIEIQWRYDSGLDPIVAADSSLFEQVLSNLLNNSIQALEVSEQKRISFHLFSVETGMTVIRIEDSGPGISESLQNVIFQPFVTNKAGGTGLGLSFVKKMMLEMGGSVEWVESTQGAIFELRLPQMDMEVLSKNEVQNFIS